MLKASLVIVARVCFARGYFSSEKKLKRVFSKSRKLK